MHNEDIDPLSNLYPKPISVVRNYGNLADALKDNPELGLEIALYDKFSEPTWRNILLATAPKPIELPGEEAVALILNKMRKDMIGV